LIAEIEGALQGLLHHPSQIEHNGCLITQASQEKVQAIGSILNRYKS
jgi:hypothetical protein